jgi:hypothetical protein
MAKNLIILFGVVFVVVGLLGFFPNPIVGANGYFVTNTVHDLVHLISGILFLIIGMSAAGSSSSALIIFGVVYGLVAILGFIGETAILGLGMVNAADNALHVVLALVFLIGGFSTKSKMDAMTMSA